MQTLFMLAASISSQITGVKAFAQNDTYLTLVKYAYRIGGQGEWKSFVEPLIAYVDNFMQHMYVGEQNLSTLLQGVFAGTVSDLESVEAQVIIPFNTNRYLEVTYLSDCVGAPLCDRFGTSNQQQTQCYKFEVVDEQTTFPLNYLSSSFAKLFLLSGMDGFMLYPGTLSYTINLGAGKLEIETKDFICAGVPSITLYTLYVEDFVHGGIYLDLRTLCVYNCIYQAVGKLQGYRFNYKDTSEIIAYIKDIYFYFAWAGTLSSGKKCRSERDAWYYYLRLQPAQSFVDAVVEYWGQVDYE